MRFHVRRLMDWGAVVRSYPPNAEPVELFRKEQPAPLATITAPDLTSALAIARLRYGREVVVSTVGRLDSVTS
jgi:hypothetical protein